MECFTKYLVLPINMCKSIIDTLLLAPFCIFLTAFGILAFFMCSTMPFFKIYYFVTRTSLNQCPYY